MLGADFVVDSSALVAIFNDESEREHFQNTITGRNWAIGWPTMLETRIWLFRHRPLSAQKLLAVIASDERVTIVPFDGDLEASAADAFATFGKGRHPARLNYGDCMAYAVARHHGLPLLFKGADFGKTDVDVHPASTVVA